MADWYVSSVVWNALPQFAASHAYSVGDIVRPLTTPTFQNQYAFRCTTAGTSSTEPSWPIGNNFTVTTGGATFTNVTGQSAYGWAAAAGNLWELTWRNTGARILPGDRAFLSSDHSETNSIDSYYSHGPGQFGSVATISVNRAGSVPPTAADAQSGAIIIGSAGDIRIDPMCNQYWQGITFTLASGGTQIFLAFSGVKKNYLKNCSIVFAAGTSSTAYIGTDNPVSAVFDNTTVTFSNASQRFITVYPFDFHWMNTPSAILGTIPTTLFQGNNSGNVTSIITCRGVDLSAVTGNLYYGAGSSVAYTKLLFDSCRIAPGVVRLGTAAYSNPADEVELVNCYNGTGFLSERHTPAGDVTSDFSITMVGGPRDDIGLFSHKMVSSSRSDLYVMTLDGFWLDVENTNVGASHTATVELICGAPLNANDVRLVVEYQGTVGSSLATFTDSASPLTTTVLPTSTATWNNPPPTIWNAADSFGVNLSGGNLTATGTTSGGIRAISPLSSGKYYWETTMVSVSNTNTGIIGIASPAANLVNLGVSPLGASFVYLSGSIWVNNVNTGVTLGSRSNGNILGCALDVGAQLIWFRVAPAGNWNASGTANPATGTGGISVSVLGSTLLPSFGPAANTESITANFGATALSGSAPAGFSSGLPPLPQRLQVIFTQQQAGRLRARVRLGRPGVTLWYNPQIALT